MMMLWLPKVKEEVPGTVLNWINIYSPNIGYSWNIKQDELLNIKYE
jgi:hypothetical protein